MSVDVIDNREELSKYHEPTSLELHGSVSLGWDYFVYYLCSIFIKKNTLLFLNLTFKPLPAHECFITREFKYYASNLKNGLWLNIAQQWKKIINLHGLNGTRKENWCIFRSIANLWITENYCVNSNRTMSNKVWYYAIIISFRETLCRFSIR